MSIYKGSELISGKIGGIGSPGINSSGGSDMGSKIITIKPGSWLNNGTEYVRIIPRLEHGMAASPALLAFTAEYNEDYSELVPLNGYCKIDTDGNITLKSNIPWEGVCIVAGGISQALDAIAREQIQEEAERAEAAENGLQVALTQETERATEAEAKALTEAKDYTDKKIADTVAATQTWLPAVDKEADLPSITDTSKTYLCRVTKENNVYQCVAGQTSWEVYSDNTDYIDEQELADAIKVETDRATAAEDALGERIDSETAHTKTHATAGTATAYTITAPELGASIYNGLTIAITPHVNSGASPTLNLNDTGAAAVYIKSTTGASKRIFSKFIAGNTYILAYSTADSGWALLNLSYPDYSEVLNTPPIYEATGQNTDGAMTQKAVTDALNTLAAGAFVPYVATPMWSGSSGNYSYTLAASTHGKGKTPLVTTLQDGKVIDCAPYIDSAGNITIYANSQINIKMEVR